MSTLGSDPNQSGFQSDEVSTTQVINDESFGLDESIGPCCEKCGAAISANEALVCKKCGWYASINSYVELDHSWEEAVDPELADASSEEQDRKLSLFEGLPKWVWLMAACVCTVVIESVAARFVTFEGSSARTFWSLTQLGLGAGAFAVCHCFAFALLLKEESDTNFSDIFLRPFNAWSEIFRELPRRQWACHAGFSGLTAALMSVLVIGGIPYEKLLDWGIEEPPKQNLMGAIMSRAQQVQSKDMDFEEALEDFAGKGDAVAENANKPKKPKPKPRQTEDCVIIGYEANEEGIVYALLIGAEHKGKLIYVGRVTPQLPEEELIELSEKLAAARTSRPFINLSFEANWVTPKFLCRVNYKSRSKKGSMDEVQLEKLLGEVSL